MKKILAALAIFIVGAFFCFANAAQTVQVQGKGYALLTGYDVKTVRSGQDSKMCKSSQNSKMELMQDIKLNKATKQAERRKKQDDKLSSATRIQIVHKAEDEALRAAINALIDQTLGAEASKFPQVVEKFENIVSQSNVYVLDSEKTGELQDNYYVATVVLTVDQTLFRKLLSDNHIAINKAVTRANSILVVLDEFFTRPSDLSKNVLTEEITTQDYRYSEKDKHTVKASLKDSNSDSAGGGYYGRYGGGGYSSSSKSNTNASYGNYKDYKKDESLFYQNIKKYDTLAPKVGNMNFTEPALQKSFRTYDLRAIENSVFKSKYFKGKPLSSDKLVNSAELAKYVELARKDVKADYFAIGLSYITDNGKNENTGKNVCICDIYIKVYSTADNELIASESLTETGYGDNADQARQKAAAKAGNALGESISIQVQDYWKNRIMDGKEYNVQIKGNFIPVERITITKALQNVEGVKNIEERRSDSTLIEYTVTVTGTKNPADAIFMKLYESNLSAKFSNYDYKKDGSNIIFTPIKK